jgi:hypothetical protein
MIIPSAECTTGLPVGLNAVGKTLTISFCSGSRQAGRILSAELQPDGTIVYELCAGMTSFVVEPANIVFVQGRFEASIGSDIVYLSRPVCHFTIESRV